MRLRLSFVILWMGVASGLTACGDSADGEGELTVTLYGEDFIELGIPADEMADGWSVNFDRFVVTVDEVRVGGVEMPAAAPTDIAPESAAAGHVIARAPVPAGRHSDSSFAITRITVTGSATKNDTTKTFDWALDHRTHYASCETVTEVSDGGAATFQITVHADHLFYDSLVAAEPQVLFQALADADRDDDGNIARAELEATDIGSYDPGSAGDVSDLWSWLVAQSGTVGHVDGEGHCDSHAHAP